MIQMYHANEKPRMLMLTTNLITERQPVVQFQYLDVLLREYTLKKQDNQIIKKYDCTYTYLGLQINDKAIISQGLQINDQAIISQGLQINDQAIISYTTLWVLVFCIIIHSFCICFSVVVLYPQIRTSQEKHRLQKYGVVFALSYATIFPKVTSTACDGPVK